jgi:[acyl-carrier-protein] S-malonyltransferase
MKHTFFQVKELSLQEWVRIYTKIGISQRLIWKANEILGFRITDIMFEGNPKSLKKPYHAASCVLHSVILAKTLGIDFKPEW